MPLPGAHHEYIVRALKWQAFGSSLCLVQKASVWCFLPCPGVFWTPFPRHLHIWKEEPNCCVCKFPAGPVTSLLLLRGGCGPHKKPFPWVFESLTWPPKPGLPGRLPRPNPSMSIRETGPERGRDLTWAPNTICPVLVSFHGIAVVPKCPTGAGPHALASKPEVSMSQG